MLSVNTENEHSLFNSMTYSLNIRDIYNASPVCAESY